MSKKRKTRKQKEQAKMRQKQVSENVVETHYYTINKIKEEQKVTQKPRKPTTYSSASGSDLNYLKKDLISIGAASGIVIAFNTLLFTLLSTGILKLNFLGY